MAVDTVGGGPTFVTQQAIYIDTAPFDVPYSLGFDNAGTGPAIIIAGGVPAELYHLCYDQDQGCNNPTPIPILDGEIVTGIDFDYPPLGVEQSSWSEIKTLYR